MVERTDHVKIIIGLAVITASLLVVSVWLWSGVRDPYGMLRHVLRMVVVVPIATALAIGTILLFDAWTPGDWLAGIMEKEHDWSTKISCALVVSSLILGVFWVCIQG